MWLLIARAPLPDAPQWPGRRILALLDAVFWPLFVAFNVSSLSNVLGLVGQVTLAACVFVGARCAARAIWRNERYRFTTVRAAKLLAVLLAIGAVLKVAA